MKNGYGVLNIFYWNFKIDNLEEKILWSVVILSVLADKLFSSTDLKRDFSTLAGMRWLTPSTKKNKKQTKKTNKKQNTA